MCATCAHPFRSHLKRETKMFIFFYFAFAGWCWWWAGWSCRKRFLRTAGPCTRPIRYTARARPSCTRCRRSSWARWASSMSNNEKWLRRCRTTVSAMHLDAPRQAGSKERSANEHERAAYFERTAPPVRVLALLFIFKLYLTFTFFFSNYTVAHKNVCI